MRQGQLDGLPDFLLLHIETTNISVCNIWLFVGTEHGDRGVSLGRQDIDEGVGVAMEGNRG